MLNVRGAKIEGGFVAASDSVCNEVSTIHATGAKKSNVRIQAPKVHQGPAVAAASSLTFLLRRRPPLGGSCSLAGAKGFLLVSVVLGVVVLIVFPPPGPVRRWCGVRTWQFGSV